MPIFTVPLYCFWWTCSKWAVIMRRDPSLVQYSKPLSLDRSAHWRKNSEEPDLNLKSFLVLPLSGTMDLVTRIIPMSLRTWIRKVATCVAMVTQTREFVKNSSRMSLKLCLNKFVFCSLWHFILVEFQSLEPHLVTCDTEFLVHGFIEPFHLLIYPVEQQPHFLPAFPNEWHNNIRQISIHCYSSVASCEIQSTTHAMKWEEKITLSTTAHSMQFSSMWERRAS